MTTTLVIEDLKMSSLDIANLTGKLHKNVIADIRTMLDDLNLTADFSATRNSRGKSYTYFNLPKRETLILVSGYSVELRAKIIDRWQELEANALAGNQRNNALLDKRSTQHGMMIALVEHREEQGKETHAHHFIIENKLCNWAITGKFEPINESELTVDDMQLLGFARRFNESLILMGIDYDERKRQLAIQVDRKRRKLTKLLAA